MEARKPRSGLPGCKTETGCGPAVRLCFPGEVVRGTTTTRTVGASQNYIIGHRNPDADAICSAIAYADLKARKGEDGWIAARCGNSNARIDAILETFRQPLPEFVGDVAPRVRDVMVRDVVRVRDNTTISEALELIEGRDLRVLPTVGQDDRVRGVVTVFQLGRFFLPRVREPRLMRQVCSSLADIARSLNARVLNLVDETRQEELYVRIAAMDIRSFGKFAQQERVTPEQSIIVVGDRWDIQQRSLQIGVRLLVVTGNLDVDDDVVEQAKAKGVSLIVSAYDSATTAWVIRTATRVDRLLDTRVATCTADESLHEARRKFSGASSPIVLVTDEEQKLLGVFTKTDLLKPVQRSLILMDHNELSQAVAGADEVTITEIIDHHRLGSVQTQQPILFINEPVGSTCTIVADLFRREGLEPAPEIAGVMMGGIIADTLHLQSPTTTQKDYAILAWLAKVAGMESRALAERIFNAGSILTSMGAEEAIRADYKIYEEEGVRFAVSQVEELGFSNFWKRQESISMALGRLQKSENLFFAALLVTDINTQNSLLLVEGAREFTDRVSYSPVDGHRGIFDLPGIVSRKKQLVPFLTRLLMEVRADAPAEARPPAATSEAR